MSFDTDSKGSLNPLYILLLVFKQSMVWAVFSEIYFIESQVFYEERKANIYLFHCMRSRESESFFA